MSREDFLSGTSGQVVGPRLTARAVVADATATARGLAQLRPLRLRWASRRLPRQRVLVLAVERRDAPNILSAARAELEHSRHRVDFVSAEAGGRGKFQNLNALLERHPAQGYDWLLVVDDDVALPRGFLDTFLFLAERFQLRLAQPAHRARSHAAWAVTRRDPRAVVRETVFVEIGPVFAFHASTFDTLLPFPDLRVGWGLDLHWSALARERSWRLGIVDATSIQHGLRRIATSYDRTDAVEEARAFLAQRPYTPAVVAQIPLVRHHAWSGRSR